jgi:hypothetical protein
LPNLPSANKATISISPEFRSEVFYMRILQILGAVLIAGGLFILIKAPSYSNEKSLFKIGGVEAKVAEQHAIPPWAGAAALGAGVVLIVVGARKP